METTEAQTELPQLSNDVGCPKCGKVFKNAVGLHMHDLRVHQEGKGWDTGQNFKGKQRSREVELAKKRDYNRRLRARYKAQGKDSRGYPKKNWPQPRKKGVGQFGAPWSPERRAKFNSTWLSKNKAKTKKMLGKKPIRIVYPDPKGVTEFDQGEVVIPTLKHCPNCGEHLEGWRYQP